MGKKKGTHNIQVASCVKKLKKKREVGPLAGGKLGEGEKKKRRYTARRGVAPKERIKISSAIH